MNPVAARLAVFGFSAALAGLGGGLYATTLGAVTPSNFDFLLQNLPLLLVTVAGGVASTGGAIFAGVVVLGTIPALIATFPAWAGPLGVLPGTMGITLGRNPDGVVTDLRHRVAPLLGSIPALVGLAALEAVLAILWINGSLSGWWAFIVGFIAPFVAARVVDRPTPEPDPLDDLELVGVDRPVTPADLEELDRRLALAEVPR
jgi:branched-chain amino acid transport system permease protein